jgi:hypothetical protein
MHLATFADGFSRKIKTKTGTLKAAVNYAKQLEQWFASGNYPGRVLTEVKEA